MMLVMGGGTDGCKSRRWWLFERIGEEKEGQKRLTVLPIKERGALF